jgi:hypothetical protein
MGENVARMGEIRNSVLRLENLKGRALGIPRRRFEDNIRIDFRGIGKEGVHCMHLTQDSDQWRVFVNTVMNLRVPQNAGNFLTS